MGFSDTNRFILRLLLGILNVLGFAIGTVLMSVAAWQYVRLSNSLSLHKLVYGVEIIVVLVIFVASGALLTVLSVLGMLEYDTFHSILDLILLFV